jgi:hypothetical protein
MDVVMPVDLQVLVKPQALQYDDPERQLQFHTGTPAGGDRRAATFHGEGTGTDDAKTNLLRFFPQVDRAVVRVIKNPSVPLVVASVDYLIPLYRTANTHPSLLQDGVPGTPEGLRSDELHARAWPLVEPRFSGTATRPSPGIASSGARAGRRATSTRRSSPRETVASTCSSSRSAPSGGARSITSRGRSGAPTTRRRRTGISWTRPRSTPC